MRQLPETRSFSAIGWPWRRYHSLAAVFAAGALLSVGAIVAHTGNSLASKNDTKIFRYCGGKCLCDGGVSNTGLLSRVCPEGWEKEVGPARRKARRRQRLRRERLRKLKAAPPPPQLPSV